MRIFICKTCIREAEINPLTDLVECPVCHQSGANIYSIREILQQIKDSMIAINEIYRILRPGGVLILTVPCGKDLQIIGNHKIYTVSQIERLLHKFTSLDLRTEKSPEADYDLALIRAVK